MMVMENVAVLPQSAALITPSLLSDSERKNLTPILKLGIIPLFHAANIGLLRILGVLNGARMGSSDYAERMINSHSGLATSEVSL